VDTDFFAPPVPEDTDPNSILLCAGFGVYRNAEAAIWFARQVFPRVREANPRAEFWIVGSNPPLEVRQLADIPGVHVTGTVEDVRPYYCRAAVSVAPYRYGEGTKLKVLEAMACGVPVVTTRIGCQGINVQDGKDIRIAETVEAFTERVTELLGNSEQRWGMGARARRLIEQEYAWTKIVGDLEPKLNQLVGEHKASGHAGAAI
jgi:glycosyltransferase involved in cell wall biosynthesis